METIHCSAMSMRKMIVELDPTLVFKMLGKKFFTKIECFEGRALIRYSLEDMSKLVITDITMKKGYTLDDFDPPEEMTILDVLKTSEIERTYTLLMKVQVKDRGNLKKYFQKVYKFLEADVIYDLPFHASETKIVISCIGETPELEKALKAFRLMGSVKQLHFQKATFTEYDPLACLTTKQKDIVLNAKKSGYYDYPRRVNSQDLADSLGISKATLIEHLRKAEIRLIDTLLAGY
jgi:DNA-binding Lrp family transcriptional regulator